MGENYTTATDGEGSKVDVSKLYEAIKILKNPDPDEIHGGYMGEKYKRALMVSAIFKQETTNIMSTFAGIPMFLDEDLPENVCEFRAKDGRVIKRFSIGEEQCT